MLKRRAKASLRAVGEVIPKDSAKPIFRKFNTTRRALMVLAGSFNASTPYHFFSKNSWKNAVF
jgi:hypothetical protein